LFTCSENHVGLSGCPTCQGTGEIDVAGNVERSDGHVVKVHKAKGMNKTEAEFGMMLEARRRRGEIDGYLFEGFKIRLADGCWYTPDFMAWKWCAPHRIDKSIWVRFYEVKGRHIWDDAKVKFRVAKEQVKWATFEMHQKTKEGWKQIL
jgi:hypothetical protein